MTFNQLLTNSVDKDKAVELANQFFDNMENLNTAMKRADELIAIKKDNVTLKMKFNEGVASFGKALGDAVEANGGVRAVVCTAVTGAAMTAGAVGFINECINASNGFVNKPILALTATSLITAAASEYIRAGLISCNDQLRKNQGNVMVANMMDTVGGLERAKSVIDAAVGDVSGVLQRYAGDDWTQMHKDAVFDALETIANDPHLSATLTQADELANEILLVATNDSTQEHKVKVGRVSKLGMS